MSFKEKVQTVLITGAISIVFMVIVFTLSWVMTQLPSVAPRLMPY